MGKGCSNRWKEIILLMLITIIEKSKEETLFISPNGDGTECSNSSPCSLSSASQLQQPNDIFTLLTGNYYLTEVINLTADNLTIISENNDYQNTIITSSANQVIFNTSSANIKIQSLSFANSSNITAIYSIGNLLYVENCVFSNISNTIAQSAAIYALNNAIILSSSFLNCSSTSIQLSIEVTINGGVIYIGQSGSIINSTFVNTFASASYYSTTDSTSISIIGGVVYIGENGILQNTTFIHVEISSYSNSVSLPATSLIYGGLVYIGLNGSISLSNFYNYTNYGYSSVTAVPESVSNISNTIMNGGAIYVKGVAFISNSNFKDSSITSSSYMTASWGDSSIHEAISYIFGGSIYIGNNATIVDTLFENSSSLSENINTIMGYNQIIGGLIYIQQYATFENISIIQNKPSTSNMNGGAIYVGNKGEIRDSLIIDCNFSISKGEGGIIVFQEGVISNMMFINLIISGPYAINGGLVAFSNDGLVIDTSFINSTMGGNSVYANGGFVYFGMNGMVINTTFSDTTIGYIQDIKGGLIYAAEYGEIRNSSFINVYTNNIYSGINYYSNYGGVVYIGGNGTVVDTIFQDITSLGGTNSIGGVVYISKNATIIRSSIINSQLMAYYDVGGGGMYIGEMAVIDSSHFINISTAITTNPYDNFAPHQTLGCIGGVIYSSYAKITNSTFLNSNINCQTKTVEYSSSSSTCSSAALYIENDLLLIDSSFQYISIISTAENNGVVLNIKGGSMFIGGNASFHNVLVNSSITSFTTYSTNSFAYLTGGVIYFNQSAEFNNVSLSNSIVEISPTFGTTSILGGILYIEDQFNLTHSLIDNNNNDLSYKSDLISSSSISISNSTIEKNLSYRIISSDIGVCQNSSIKWNTAAMSIINLFSNPSNISYCYFIENEITSDQTNCNGVLTMEGGEISNSYFINNNVGDCQTSAGVAVYQTSNNNLIISNSTFDGNSFTSCQSISVIYSQSLFDIDQLHFINHPNIQTSLIYFDVDIKSALLLITNSSFEMNYFSLSSSQFISFSSTDIVINYIISTCHFIGNGGANSYSFLVTSSNFTSISNCNFESNNNMILQSIDSNLLIFQSNFTSNEGSKSIIQMSDSTSQSNITISNSNFISNIISSSNTSCNGVLYIDNNFSNITQCTFTSNQINCPIAYGGALTITSNVNEIILSPNTLFQSNSIIGVKSYGAAIYSEIPLSLSQIQFVNNSLIGNTILEGFGAALYISTLDNNNNNSNNISILQCSFENNYIFSKNSQILSTYSGGAIFINLNSNNKNTSVLIDESLFEGNSIISETSLSVFAFPILRIITGSSISIQSDDYLQYTENILQISRSNISGSVMSKGCPLYQITGGIIYSSIPIQLNDCRLNDNEILTAENTKSISGALLYSQISISSFHSLFYNNTISLYHHDNDNNDNNENDNDDNSGGLCGVETVTNIVLGGVIYSEGVNISNCLFEHNQVSLEKVEGGVIWMKEGSIQSSSFNSNIITNTKEGSASTTSSSGGAIWSSSSGILIANSSFTNNIADFGGAIAIDHFYSYPSFINVSITSNKANQNGGAIYIINNSLNEILNCSSLGTIAKNEYRYGGECGSVSKSLDFYSRTIKEVFPSQSFSIDLCLNDWFDQLVINPFMSVSLSPSNYLSIGILNEYTLYPDSFGVYSYFSLSLYSQPGAKNDLLFTSQINEPNYEREEIFNRSTTITTGSCPPMLIYQYSSSSQLSSCVTCGISQYNLNGSGCYDCPSTSFYNSVDQCVDLYSASNNVQSPYYSSSSSTSNNNSNINNIQYIKIEGGWWPNQFTNPDYLIPCPFDGACLPIYCLLLPNVTSSTRTTYTTDVTDATGWVLQCEQCDSNYTLTDVYFDNYYYQYHGEFNTSKYNETKCDYCSEGYTETFCSQCECNSIHDCYFLRNQQCIECTIYSGSHLAMLIIGIIILIIIIPIIIIIPKSTIFWIIIGFIGVTVLALAGVLSWYYYSLLLILLFCYLFMDKQFPEGLLKCLFYYLQIISSIVVISAWPPAFRGLVQTFQIANLEINFLTCFWPSLLSNPLHLFILFNLIVPILVILLSIVLIMEGWFSLLPFVRNLRRSLQIRLSFLGIIISDQNNDDNNDDDKLKDRGYDGEEEVNSLLLSPDSSINDNELEENNSHFIATFTIEKPINKKKRKYISKISKLVLSICSAAYLPIALMSFSMITCTDGYMNEYHWIPCSSSSFIYFVLIAVFVIISFVIAYPLILLIILLFYRSSNEFHFVFENYREGAYYYEFIFIVKKLIIVLLLTLFKSNSPYQQFLLASILCLGIAVLYHIRPFKSNSLNICSHASEIVICFSYFYNIIYLDVQINGETMLLSSWVVMALNIIIIFFFLYLIIRNHSLIRRFSCSPKKYTYL